MDLVDLDDLTREAMRNEVERDAATGRLYLSPRLSELGVADYADLLVEAVEAGNDGTLARALAVEGRLRTSETARNPRGGSDIVKAVPVNAAQTLAEGEFNRFYARGVCIRALAEDGSAATVTVYRARESANPRSASLELIGSAFSAADLLDDLRRHPGMDTALGLPSGPNSGLSVRRSE